MNLTTSWQRCWTSLVGNANDELKETLIAAWNEPQRHYHTLQHLSECLQLFDQFRHLAERPHEVELAIWFHDAIYDVKGKQNELKSAQWAEHELEKAGVDSEVALRVYDLIMATVHGVIEIENRDQQLLVDIDLAILGSRPKRFAQYEKQVRQEYRFVPYPIYWWKRRQILKAFLVRKPIYQLPELQEKFELQARENLMH